jgi:hypothetical protein
MPPSFRAERADTGNIRRVSRNYPGNAVLETAFPARPNVLDATSTT